MSPKNTEFNNAIVLDSNFILLPFDYINEIYLLMEGKTRFLIFKQSLNELEAGNARFDPKPKTFRKKNVPELSYLDQLDMKTKAKPPKVQKIKRRYKGAMKYLEKNEKIFPIYFIDDVKNANETTEHFLLSWCRRFKKEYRNLYLCTSNTDLLQQARNAKIDIIYLIDKNRLTIETSKK